MANKLRPEQFVLAAMVIFAAMEPQVISGNQAPAGQMCPNGSYVVGFDSEGNIVCTETCGNEVLNTGEACDDGNTETGDGCSSTCQFEGDDLEVDDEKPVAKPSAANLNSLPSIPDLIISDVEPSTVVFGTSEIAITVIGTGFHAESVIIFEGSTYKPVVNQAGTRLDTTIPTAKLSIGSYAIKVSNGSGLENTLRRALAVY
jgi:cysteine-rich repeat protein